MLNISVHSYIKKYRNINSTTVNLMIKVLKNKNWLDVYKEKETENKYSSFIHKFKSIFNENWQMKEYKISTKNKTSMTIV